MGRLRNFVIGEFYHIYNRGTDKRIIFKDNFDYERFLMLMFLCNGEKFISVRDITDKKLFSKDLISFDRGNCLVDIVSYCLMPNHFHFVLKERVFGGISKFIQKLNTGYSTYFNIKYNRNGNLFQGKFKDEHINNNSYFNYIFAYIGLNPLSILNSNWKENGISDKKKSKDFLINYKYSGYLDHIGFDRNEKIILNEEILPEYLENFDDFENFIDEFFA